MNIIKKKYSEFSGIRTVAMLADPACRTCWGKNTPPLLEHVWRTHRPELFLVAGDLAVNGTSDEYRTFISALERYPAMLAAVPGDHDRPLRVFVNHFGSTRKVIDVGKWRFIGVNTANRMFPKSEADFLDNHIRPNTVIFTHIPPGVAGWTFHSFRTFYSNRFFSIIDRHTSNVTAAFFGHIHGYSRREYSGVPLFCTGGVAESWTVRDNRYTGPGSLQMMIFDTRDGKFTLCGLD
ncbi:MAG: metallophosphoesterase [Acidobacteria bacterium]|nr:metallophosphoesterase [Acidobacteriota bacterium]